MTLPDQPTASFIPRFPADPERPTLLPSTLPIGRRSLRWTLLIGAAALLGGCASFSADGGMGAIQSATYADIGKQVVKIGDDQAELTTKARVDQLLRKPLTADAAVQIALLNNRGLQAAFNELGMAEAQDRACAQGDCEDLHGNLALSGSDASATHWHEGLFRLRALGSARTPAPGFKLNGSGELPVLVACRHCVPRSTNSSTPARNHRREV